MPGTWVLVPEPGLLWTPGYWARSDGLYVWHAGYWGPQVSFYGGVNYGYGYSGTGYQGAYWNNGALYYNRSVNNVNVTNVHNVYNTTVVNNTTVNNVSYITLAITAAAAEQPLVQPLQNWPRLVPKASRQRPSKHSTNVRPVPTARNWHP